jgi:hypothetical protein
MCGGLYELLTVPGIVYVVCCQVFCIWIVFSLAFCLQSRIECSAKSFPMCWLERELAGKVYDLVAAFSCIDILVRR